jgi:hypothetical protein
MNDILGLATVRPAAEVKARDEIERAGFGTRVLSYRSAFYRKGKRYVRVRPLIPGYVMPALGPGWGAINDIEGVKVLADANGAPLRICGRDADRLNELERHCLFGDFNKVEYRSGDGANRKPRRRRPRKSKRISKR